MLKRVSVVIVGLLLSISVAAQSPFGINYQGVARNADGSPIANKAVGLRISITQGPGGTTDFTEDHQVTTNEFGLFAVVIGKGQSGDNIQDVDWSAGNKWLQIELDAEGNGSFELVGTQQLMSVPYALFAQESADQLNAGFGININNGDIINTLPDRTVGLIGAGGILITGNYPNYTIDGSSFASTTYVDNSSSTVQAGVDANTAGLALEITNRTNADNGLQAELDATQAGAGLETNGTYAADGSTNYLDLATDLKDADKILDAEVNINANNIATLTGRLDNTFAFHAQYSINEPTGAFKISVALFETSDNFNQIDANEITIGADGLYMIVINAERSNSDVNLELFYLRINGIDYRVPIFTDKLNFGRTQMINLTSGDKLSLLVSPAGPMGPAVNGTIGGYRINH